MKELLSIQAALKVEKSQYNKFGNYKYRSAEDILKAVKPLLQENKCVLTLSDDIQAIGNRIYVKATATLTNESGEATQVNGYAREEDTKKGMDEAQITGACSSYARKYALNGLFAIDDGVDADSLPRDEKKKTTTAKKTDTMAEAMKMIAEATNVSELAQIYNENNALQADSEFVNALTKRKKELVG